MKNIAYKFWAGPGGRIVTRRIQRFKKAIFILSGVAVLEAVAIAALVMAYFKLLQSII